MAVVVVGNPKPMSRTRAAAELLVRRLMDAEPTHVIDVIDLGQGLLSWGHADVANAKEIVKSADLLVVASPTFKATYSGVLKLFLDQFAPGELGQVPTVALMLGAAETHALAPELTLRPVLVEIGASCPFPSLYLLEDSFDSAPRMEAWLAIARTSLAARRRAGNASDLTS